MAYIYTNKNKTRKCLKKIRQIINCVQNDLRDKIRFHPQLVGSNKYSLVTTNGINGYYDVDFTFIITESVNWEPYNIRKLIFNSIKKYYEVYGFNGLEEGKRSIKLKYSVNNQLKYYVEIAIYTYIKEQPYILKFDKTNHSYIWNEESMDIYNLEYKFYLIKKNNLWEEFRNLYLWKKNSHLTANNNMKSLYIYKETVNEIFQKYFD